MIPALITGITCLMIGAIAGAFIERRNDARKRDELGYFLSRTIPHDPQEAVRRAG